MLTSEGGVFAGGTILSYAAVVIAALCLGVLVTVLCFRIKK